MYLAEEAWRERGVKADIQFWSSLGVIFGVKKYADALWQVVKSRGNITVNLRHNLIEIIPETKEAVFENLDSGDKSRVKYDMIHVTPPMEAPQCISSNKDLSDQAGFLSVNKETLQHTK